MADPRYGGPSLWRAVPGKYKVGKGLGVRVGASIPSTFKQLLTVTLRNTAILYYILQGKKTTTKNKLTRGRQPSAPDTGKVSGSLGRSDGLRPTQEQPQHRHIINRRRHRPSWPARCFFFDTLVPILAQFSAANTNLYHLPTLINQNNRAIIEATQSTSGNSVRCKLSTG